MSGEFRMPSLGADMEVGTILEWRIKPGDVVHRGDIVAVVDTEKADIEVEVFDDGIVDELVVDVGETVPVGTLLARITTSAPAVAPPPAPATPPAAPIAPAPPPAPTGREPVPVGVGGRASPYARRLAGERDLDLATIAGSGPAGAVLAADLAAPVAGADHGTASPRRPARDAGDRRASTRQSIAELMARSKREIPHYYVATTVDLGPAMDWLGERNASRPVVERILPAAVLLRATALAARQVPELNGFWEEQPCPAEHVHLGVAISLRGGGLVAPAIPDADGMSVDETMRALHDLVERARAGRLRSSDVAGPTITVTNLGEQGADEVFGVIYPPQVAIVGFGRVVRRPWAIGDLIGVRPTVRATLAGDHRATDGHTGARFLAVIDRLLQHPEDL